MLHVHVQCVIVDPLYITDDTYNIPKVTDCTAVLNEWVYPPDGDRTRLMSRQPQQLPELVRRFTQDIYMCVYIQPDVGMYGDKDELGFGQSRNYGISTVTGKSILGGRRAIPPR